MPTAFDLLKMPPLNETHEHRRVNFLEYTETSPKGKQKKFTWITDFQLSKQNVISIARGGRTRWRIENETFNTLKNQGYQFEHNFGHGKEHLSHVFAKEMACNTFNKALKRLKRRKYLWQRIMSVFFNFVIKNWDDLFNGIANIMPDDRPTFYDSG